MSWHKLRLINGWKSSQKAYGSGDPSWAVKNGIVYLSGSMHQNGSASEFAVLPPAARPKHLIWITVYTYGDTTGVLNISPDGPMFVLNTTATDTAMRYTSLAAVSFPAAGTGQHKLALLNGWKTFYSTDHPSYSVSHGIVYLSGSLHQPTGANQEFAVLPSAARPARTLYITIYAGDNATGVLKVDPAGAMSAYSGGAQAFTSLADVSFPAGSVTRHKLTLTGGWQSAEGPYRTGDPSYAVVNGVVYLYGSLLQPAAAGEIFAQLPRAARPAHNLWIKVCTNSGNIGTMFITPNGYAWAYSNPAVNAQVFTSLASISYPLNS